MPSIPTDPNGLTYEERSELLAALDAEVLPSDRPGVQQRQATVRALLWQGRKLGTDSVSRVHACARYTVAQREGAGATTKELHALNNATGKLWALYQAAK